MYGDGARPYHRSTQAGTWRRVTGLTPGTAYNAVTVHKVLSAGNATIFSRSIMVSPLT